VAALTWVDLELLTQRRDARPDARLAKDSDGVGGGATQTPHGVEDALRQRLTVPLLTDAQRDAEHRPITVVGRLAALHQPRHQPTRPSPNNHPRHILKAGLAAIP